MNASGCTSGSGSRTHFWLDVTIALVFSALVGTGVLLEWILTRGSGAAWLGLDRHRWSEAHLGLGLALGGLVVTHLVLHRAWLARCWGRFVGTRWSPLSWAIFGVAAALILLPLLVPVTPGAGCVARGGPASGATLPGLAESPRAHGPRWRRSAR